MPGGVVEVATAEVIPCESSSHAELCAGSRAVPGTQEPVDAVRPHGASSRCHRKRRRWLSLKLVIVASMCLFTLGPAIALWLLSWQAGNSGIDDIGRQGESSLEESTMELCRFSMHNTESAFLQLIQPAEDLLLYQSHRLKGKGLLELPGPTAAQNYSYILETLGLHFWMLGSNYITMNLYSLQTDPSVSYPEASTENLAMWTSWTRLNLDLTENTTSPTLYVAESLPNEFLNASILQFYFLNQSTGERMGSVYQRLTPLNAYAAPVSDVTRPEYYSWRNELYFNENTGLVELELDYGVPTTDKLAAHRIAILTTVYTVSSFLKGLLTGPKQRLFVFFRTPAGTLIGASHGKYFSHSDVDYSRNDPIINRPPVAQFRRYT
eukprot:RCo006797